MWDFPNSPAVGASFTPASGGPTYTWNGSVWLQGSPGSILTARRGNLVVNGAMQISQENGKGTAYTAVNTFAADQWQFNFSTAGAPTITCNLAAAADPISDSYLRINNTTADASVGSTDVVRLLTNIEGNNVAVLKWGLAQAIPAVWVFKARSSILGTFTAQLREYSSSAGFVKGCQITQINTWQAFVIPVPACTIGTWTLGSVSSIVMQLFAMWGLASSPEGWVSSGGGPVAAQSNWMSATGQTLDFADVGLYADPDNTGLPPPWEVPDYATELVRCQRYFSSGNSFLVGSYGANGQIVYTDIPHKVLMRGTPAVTIVGTPTYSNASAMSSNGATPNMARLQVTVAAAGYGYGFSGNLTLNARM
jgi:hypothetical protein